MFDNPPHHMDVPFLTTIPPFRLLVLRNFAKPWVSQPHKNSGKFKLPRKTADILQITFYYDNACNFEQSFLGILISGSNYTFAIIEMIVFLTRIIK